MTPILSNLRRFTSYLSLWMLVGIVIAALFVSNGQTSWMNALVFAIPLVLVYSFIAASAYYLCRSQTFEKRNFVGTVVVFCSAAAISAGIWLILCLAWNQFGVVLLRGSPDSNLNGCLINFNSQLQLLMFATGFVLYLLSIFAHDALIALENARHAEQRVADASLQLREAQLQVLRAQINPHFLFNSLNSISALTSFDPAAARTMTLELAQFFRHTLAFGAEETITLAQELQLCEHFLAVEKIRFGDKLEATFSIDTEAREIKIPPMILQPCLENAIKYGIRTLTEGGVIEVNAVRQHDWLHISIENPCEPDDSKVEGTGTGLLNIRQRLRTVYNDQASAIWEQSADRFVVKFVIPIREK